MPQEFLQPLSFHPSLSLVLAACDTSPGAVQTGPQIRLLGMELYVQSWEQPCCGSPCFPIAASSPGSCPWSLCPVSYAQPLPPGPDWPAVPGTSLITICWSGGNGLQAVPGCCASSPTFPPTTMGLHIIPLPTSLPHLSLTITCLEVLSHSR